MMKTILSILLVSFWISGCARPLSDSQRNEKNQTAGIEFQKTKTLVESNQFKVHINRVMPQNGMNTERFNPQGTITINDSVAKGDLPFFGRAYSINPTEDGGIKFDDVIRERSIKTKERRKNKTILYEFSVRGNNNDTYNFYMDIASNGIATISVTSNNRSPITYYGEISPLEKVDN